MAILRTQMQKQCNMKKLAKLASNGARYESTLYAEDPALSAISQSDISFSLSMNCITITDPTSDKALHLAIEFSYLLPSTRTALSPFTAFK
jgi:hypothetical protein